MATVFRVFTRNRLPKIMATPVTTTLLGPPEIYKQNPTTTPSSSSASTNSSSPSAAIKDHLFTKTNFNQPPPRMWPTFRSTGNPCLDFFFHVVPNISHRKLKPLLKISWDHDPLKTLKLICNLRSVKGKGKFDKENYYTAVLWLHEHHPQTLAFNVASLADCGYLKDLPEILFRLLQGSESRKSAKELCHNKFKAIRKKYPHHKLWSPYFNNKDEEIEWLKKVSKFQEKYSAKVPRLEFPELTRHEKKIERAKKVIERFNSDRKFKILHDRVSGIFADRLRSDMKLLGNGDCNINNISLAAKWCPSLDSSYDQYTLLCESIAKKVFPREEYEEYVGIEEGHYVYRVRERLRKQVLVPLRKALELPEVYIGANDWGSIPYNRVSSVAMRLYKDKFVKHDGERFKDYCRKVEEEKAKIKAAAALLPHEIIASLDDEDGGQVAELQWKRMVDDMLRKRKLSNCIAICEVSRDTMCGIQRDVCFALGILLSELNVEPWKGKLITLSETPVLHRVEGETLKEKSESLQRMEVDYFIDFSKVYDLILDVAVNSGLKPDEMIKRLFVFTSNDFHIRSSEASIVYNPKPWEEIYEAIVRKYRERGYGDSVPEMVFWNLNESKAKIVPIKILHGNFPGVSMVNGISKKLMKLFLEGGDMNTEAVMDAAISGEEYKKLVVLD